MKLLVISDQPHYLDGGRVVGAFDAVVREIDALSELFEAVTHVATRGEGAPPPQAAPYRSGRVRTVLLDPAGGPRLRDKLGVLARYPAYARVLRREIDRADAVYLRCPANFAPLVLALLAVRRRPRRRWYKYAGDWRPRRRDSISYRLQRLWLRRAAGGAWVSVNGDSENEPPHVVSFLNPSYSIDEVREAAASTAHKSIDVPVRLVFVGRLHPNKGAARAVRIAQGLAARGIAVELDVAGEGEERAALERMIREADLGQSVRLHGWLARPALNRLFARAHFTLLPSSSEGWPKALSEGMPYRSVPLGGDVGGVRSILEAAGAGRALPPEDVDLWIDAIARLVEEPRRWEDYADHAAAAARLFTFEAHLERVRAVFGLNGGLGDAAALGGVLGPGLAPRARPRAARSPAIGALRAWRRFGTQ